LIESWRYVKKNFERKEINFTSTCRAVSSAAVLNEMQKCVDSRLLKKIEIVFDSI